MLRFTVAVFATLFVITNCHAQIVIAESTFDTDLDGWTIPQEGADSDSWFWSSTGGNPGGYGQFFDKPNPVGNASAPSKFLGDWRQLDSVGTLSFDHLVIDTGDLAGFGPYFASIEGPGGRAVWNGDLVPTAPTPWTTIEAPVAESAWQIELGSWDSILANVTKLVVKVEYYTNNSSSERTGLDNVRLTIPVPEPNSLALVAAGLAAIVFRRR